MHCEVNINIKWSFNLANNSSKYITIEFVLELELVMHSQALI